MPGATTYSKYIWDYFMDKIGNEYGVAGLMGNLYAESALRPNNLQQTYETSLGYTDTSYTEAVNNGSYSEYSFVHDSAGYGLAQWTYWSRKQNMYDKFKSGGYSSIGGIDLACDFLWKELSGTYKGVLSVLKSADSVRVASDKVLHDFERPANQSTSVEEKRASYSQDYYDLYSGTTPGGTTPEPEEPEDPEEPEVIIPGYIKKHKMSLLLMSLATRR